MQVEGALGYRVRIGGPEGIRTVDLFHADFCGLDSRLTPEEVHGVRKSATTPPDRHPVASSILQEPDSLWSHLAACTDLEREYTVRGR